MKYDFKPLEKSSREKQRASILVVIAFGLVFSAVFFNKVVVLTILLVAAALATVPFIVRYYNAAKQAYQVFVSSNQLRSLSDAEMLTMIPAVLRDLGDRSGYEKGLEFDLDGLKLWCMQYYYEVDIHTSKGTQTRRYNFTIAAFNLTKQYPQLFLDAKSNGSNYRYDRSQRISLEGNFDESFNLYAPASSGSAALAIITPDVMQVLIDQGRTYDIEINEQLVCLIASGDQYNQRALPAMLHFGQEFSKQLLHKDLSWRPLPLADGKPMQLKQNRFSTATIVMIIIVIFFAVFMVPNLIRIFQVVTSLQ